MRTGEQMRQRVRELKAQINDLYADAAVLESELMDIEAELDEREEQAVKEKALDEEEGEV